MLLNIGNKETELNFGIRFTYELNKKYKRIENNEENLIKKFFKNKRTKN